MTVMEATRTIVLPSGEDIPVLGQGTWHMAENPLNRTNKIKALRLGIDLGMSLIDTAEMYAERWPGCCARTVYARYRSRASRSMFARTAARSRLA